MGEIYKQVAPRTLAAFVWDYLGLTHGDAHGAGADTAVLIPGMERMLARHAELGGKSDDDLALLSAYGKRLADPAGRLMVNDAGDICFTMKRAYGVPVKDDIGLAQWMLDRDFPESTKRVLRCVLGECDETTGGRDDQPGLFDGNPSEMPF